MILEDIKDKLLEIDDSVYYGMVHSEKKETLWNYIVFNRTTMKASNNKTGYTDGFIVHIVREEWIPDGLAEDVIEKLTGKDGIDGMRLGSVEMKYTYVPKGNTDTVVEMLSIEFVKPRKKA